MALLLTVETQDNPPTRVLSPEARATIEACDPFFRYREISKRLNYLDITQRLLYTDCTLHLPDCFLEKVDKSTMAQGIEVRVPFLDTHLTRYAMGLPSSLKVRYGQNKWILKRALRGIVPKSILDGPKTGFGVPFEFWLRTSLKEYMRSVLLDPTILSWGIFSEKALERCIDEHISQRRQNGLLLYKLLNLSLWYHYYLK
jgi:asparagine synthase (glutamine-hydrolysing)